MIKKKVNPYRVLYWNPSLPVIKFAKMAEGFHNRRDLEMLQKIAELTGWDLIPSSKLNWRQRKKWVNHKFQVGVNVYYLVPPPGQIKILGKEEQDAQKALP